MSGVALYDELTPDVALGAREAAQRIRVRITRSAADIIEIGRDLIAVKAAIGHGNFLPWIKAEFSMSEQTARNFMAVAGTFGKSQTVGDLPPTVLYALAAPSTPEPVREEAMRRAEAGEGVDLETIAQLKREILDAKQAAKDAKRDERVQKDLARQASEDRAKMLRDLEWEKAKVVQQAREIEALKQDGVIHVYPAAPVSVAPVAAPAPSITPRGSCFPAIAALIADGCRRDLPELIAMLRSENLLTLAQELETLTEQVAA